MFSDEETAEAMREANKMGDLAWDMPVAKKQRRFTAAVAAMQGLIQSETEYRLDYLDRFSNGEENDGDPDFNNKRYCRAVAHDAAMHADALLAELDKEPTQ